MSFPGPRRRAALWLATLTGLSFSAPASSGGPLYVKNLSPVSGLFGLPSQRSAQTQDSGTFGLALHGSIANHYVNEFRDLEAVNLDGETGRLAFEGLYGLAENWDLQLEIPWMSHSGGHLDSLIDNWHSLWGMSDGGRSNVPRDLLDYRFVAQGEGFELVDDASGVGDVSVSLSHAFYRREGAAASVVLGYKFGTGDEDQLLGSGSDDAFLAIRYSGDHLSSLPLRWHGQFGYLRAGKSDLLGDTQERDLWFAGLTLDWAVHENWSVIGQLDAHAPPVDSKLTALGDEAVMLSLGARWKFSRRWALDFSLVEDVQVETAPDITFQASVRYSGAE